MRTPSRSIPTGVGTTNLLAWERGGSSGPSPRAWGLQSPRERPRYHLRSIPTGVGTTGCAPAPPQTPPVHPHGRGDYLPVRADGDGLGGPSPRAWGLQDALPLRLKRRRSIPTGVGTTSPSGPMAMVWAVHPHGRGDYRMRSRSASNAAGPSPRAWGLRPPGGRQGRRRRSIPTGVGTTTPPSRRETWPSVHPHGRGDYLWTRQGLFWRLGPSPRAWGLHPRLGHPGPGGRSIPTGVGTTLDQDGKKHPWTPSMCLFRIQDNFSRCP